MPNGVLWPRSRRWSASTLTCYTPPAPAGVPWQADAVTAPLDIATVMKAAHAITSELVLEDFLRELVRIAIENAGAQRGVFLQAQDGQLSIAAEGSVDAGAVTLVRSQPVTSG